MIMRARTRQLPALVAAAVVFAITIACAACGSSPASSDPGSGNATSAGFPATITSFAGRVHVPTRPVSIISLSPTATEMLYAIGAGSQVKAVDDDSDYPRQAPMTKLSGYEPNVEAIAAYKPDLVVISNDIDDVTAKLQALSVPVLDLPAAANLSQEYAEFDQLGRATGHLTQAEHEVTGLKSQVSKILASQPKHSAPLTYYYEVSTDPYYSVTSSTFIGGVLSLLGMKSIADAASGAAASGGYPSLSAEFILKSNPDYIILSDTGPTGGGQDAATVTSRPGWSVLTAVKDKHFILLNADIASRWGPRIVDLLQDVATALQHESS
jgi:iron complex transport system substrate-binding protein